LTALQLPPDRIAAGDRLCFHKTLDSTMEEARRTFASGVSSPVWIVAGEQIAGRGRQGRVWTSPPGNLHVTLLLPTQTLLRDQPKLGFVAGVALARAIGQHLPAHTRLQLKWPNDVLIGGAKVSGLLLEGLGQGAAVAIGMGVNIVAHPPDTPYTATHLRAYNPKLTREMLFASLAKCLGEELDSFSEGCGFPLTRQRWLAQAAHLGKPIRIRQQQITLEGIFLDIDADGRLKLQTADGLVLVDAGDVFPLDK
jgi:BirA family biotin operon repressor/biotin-[acetyl-CoA-carboxylase] ligase